MIRLRRLKIYQKHQHRKKEYIIVPEIRLEGKWLKEFGFEIGKEIEIKQEKNKLTITIAPRKKNN